MAINVLPPRVYNRISAGEVVEKPASVVKELVENSLDAGASQITVEIEGGGIKKISVSDNGCGISKKDLPLAFLPHATSKINNIDDLDNISTLGFRGEALASIASVSMVKLTTKTKDSEFGYKIEANGGEISNITELARVDGTSVSVENLFYNTPARAKFLRKPKSEESDITHLMEKFMLSKPEVEFCYVVDGKEIYRSASCGLDEVIYLIYGRDVYDNLLKLDHKDDGIQVSGYVVSPKLSKPNRTYQSLFVNGRYVENYMVSACVQNVYSSMLMKGRFPIYVIKLDIPFDRVDVNVHPNKKEVKFDNSSKIFGIINRAVEKALVGANLIAEFFEREEKMWSGVINKDKLDPLQEENNLARTGFDAYQKTNLDKMFEAQGAKQIKVDDELLSQKFLTQADYKKKGIDVINMPDFNSVKSEDKKKKNRPGGNIFFDSSGEGILYEVELAVKEKMKQEEPSKKNEQNLQKNTQNFVEDSFLKVRAEEIKIVGVVFKTYIITEFGDSLYVIDQHAMHERQNYEKLKAEIEKGNVAKQDLLIPFDIVTNSKERTILEERLQNLKKIGFEIEQNGNTFKVKSVPFVLSGMNLDKFIQEILQDDSLKDISASGLINEKLCQSACKHSIRAGDSISKDEILYLIDKIKESVPLCPHGRPIIVKITMKELEKMFKRTL